MDRRRVRSIDGSLNELGALALRAARGAGRPWGLADDAGWAVRWLEARGLPGASLLAAWLDAAGDFDPASSAPAGAAGVWAAPGGRLCPLLAGAALADRAEPEVVLGPVACPLLLAPFAAVVALANGRGLELAWEGALLRLAVDGEGYEADGPELVAAAVAGVSLHPATRAIQPGRIRPRRPRVADATWQRLEISAARTYLATASVGSGATGGAEASPRSR